MGYSTTLMTAGDRDAVLKLWEGNLAALHNTSVLARRFNWFYQENPAGKVDTMLAVNDEDSAVVGCASAFPRTYRLGGREVRAGVPVDFAVARPHRTAAAALKIQRDLVTREANGFSFFCGFPNKSALPVLKRVGYKEFAASASWVKPLRANYKVASYLPGFLVGGVSTVPNMWLALADRRRAAGRAAVRTEFVTRADARFDDLWTRARDRYSVAGERTAAYLNWRYTGYPMEKYQFFCMSAADSGKLLGYVAFYSHDRKVFIGDVFAVDMQDTAEQLLLEFARGLRARRFDSIFVGYAGNEEFERRLKELGFIARGGERRSLVALPRTLSSEEQQVLLNKEHWFLFDGEMDI